MNKVFRKAGIDDLAGIVSIYNEAIKSGFQTADLEEVSVEDKTQWFNEHQIQNYELFVLEVDEQMVGWLSLSPYRKGRRAFEEIAEISYYLTASFQSKGLGSFMMQEGINRAKQLHFRNLIAILLAANSRSIALLNKFGFEEWGSLPNLARINHQLVDHLYFGLKL
jgi:phosphinothricin acetyltransferase